MDCGVWEKTILAWVNSMNSGIPLTKINQLSDVILLDIIKKFKCDIENPIDFLKSIFPNLSVPEFFTLASSYDFLSAATCLLIYISFSKDTELNELRDIMCRTLDNTVQQNIAAFLTSFGSHHDVFQLSFKLVTKEIFNFIETHGSQSPVIGDGLSTPVKTNNVSNTSFDSPLQGFFQTPKRSQNRSGHKKATSVMCGDGDHIKHIKQLKDHLAEEELEKATLQEKLAENMQKCNEYETKLKDKIKEIKQLKQEWEAESKKNEDEVLILRDKIKKKSENEKKLKSELSHVENFVTSIQTDLADSHSDKVKLEHQLKLSLDKYTACEVELKEMMDVNMKLQEVLSQKEKELDELRENFENCYKGQKCIDVSYTDGSLDTSVSAPETMDVVVEKLLREKINENSTLKDGIEDLKTEKTVLLSQLEQLKSDILAKDSTISELQYLNKELCAKVEKFDATEKELCKTQEDLTRVNNEIQRLMKENSQLTEKCDALNSKSEKHEHAYIDCKNSKMLLQFDFFKLAHDLKSVQHRLETEVNNMTKLMAINEVGHSDKKEMREISPDQTFDYGKTSVHKDTSIDTVQKFYSGEEKMKKLQELLNHLESYDRGWSESKITMQKACLQLNDSIVALKFKINDLEDDRKNIIEEKTKLEMCLKTAEEKIMEIQNFHSLELQKLRIELKEKASKIAELESYILKMKNSEKNKVSERVPVIDQTDKLPNDVTFIYEGGDFKKENPSVHTNLNKNLPLAIKKLSHLQSKELNDSLEEIPVCSKTFEIVNLDEKDIIDKTFSIKKENLDILKENKNGSSWSVSPPSKTSSKSAVRPEKRRTRGESWIVPLAPAPVKQGNPKRYSSNELAGVDSCSNLTKSSSLSSIMEVTSSPHSKLESKTSGATSFFSVTDLIGSLNRKYGEEPATDLRKAYSSELYLRDMKSENSLSQVFKLVDRQEDPLGDIFKRDLLEYDGKKREWDKKFSQMRKEIVELSNECERLRSCLVECESKRKKDKEGFEKNQATIAESITSKYEIQLEQLKTEMKQLYNRELAKHKIEQSKLNTELRKENKFLKEHGDNLRNQLWDVREKLIQEQDLKKDLEKLCSDLKKKYEKMLQSKESDSHKGFQNSDAFLQEPYGHQEKDRIHGLRPVPNSSFPTIPTEDEDEVFDNRFLEDLKKGRCPSPENPEDRLKELQNRNTLVLPHLKSSYPAETQFHNPSMYKETDLKFGLLQFGQESQSLTDSDHSMTRLIPENKGKKKEQTSYKKPGPPTPSKHGGRLSLQGGDFRITPRNALKELTDPNEKNKGTPKRLRSFLPKKRESLGGIGAGRDENTIPVTPRKKIFGKSGKILRKPFGARDH